MDSTGGVNAGGSPGGKSIISRSCCIQFDGMDTRVLPLAAVSRSLRRIEKLALGSEMPVGGGRSSFKSASG